MRRFLKRALWLMVFIPLTVLILSALGTVLDGFSTDFYVWDARSLERNNMQLVNIEIPLLLFPLWLLLLRAGLRRRLGKEWMSLTRLVPYRFTQIIACGMSVLMCWEVWRLLETVQMKQHALAVQEEWMEMALAVWSTQQTKTFLLGVYLLYVLILLVKQWRYRRNTGASECP